MTKHTITAITTHTSSTGGSASLRIDAPADRIWPLISDPVRMGEFSPENTGARWRDGATRASVGARFRGFNRRGLAVWYTECVVRTCEPEREFSFDVAFPPVIPLVATWTWRLEPDVQDPSRTNVTVSWQLPREVGRARRLFYRSFGVTNRERDLAAGTSATLRRIAAAAGAGQ